MAAQNATQVAKIIREAFKGEMVHLIRRDAPFATVIKVPETTTYQQKDIRWKVLVAGNASAGSYAENDTLNQPGSQSFAEPSLPWKQQHISIGVTGLSQAISKSEGLYQPDAIANETKLAILDFLHLLASQMISDGKGHIEPGLVAPGLRTGGTDVDGIQAIIDDGSLVPEYAGIDREEAPWWRSVVMENGGSPRDLTEDLLLTMLNELRGNRGARIDRATCSLAVRDAIYHLLRQDRVIPQTKQYDGGYESVSYSGVDFIGLPDYPNGRIDFFNSSTITYETLLPFNVKPRDAGFTDKELFIGFHYGNMVGTDPWRCGSLRDIRY